MTVLCTSMTCASPIWHVGCSAVAQYAVNTSMGPLIVFAVTPYSLLSFPENKPGHSRNRGSYLLN
jgi:hypothetical protein